MGHIILASSSAYRQALLQRLAIPFSCITPDVDETPSPAETPAALALRLAQSKSTFVAQQFPTAIVIGADQVAELNGAVLNKPGNHRQAVKQLTAQSGQNVLFHSALAVTQLQTDGQLKQHSVTDTCRVTFRHLKSEQIRNYLKAEQPYDCAGSFKAEGLGISLFSAIHSHDPTSLIGLPLISLCSILEKFELKVI